MSINSNKKEYALKRYIKTYDELGTLINTWADVEDVEISVNYKDMQSVENGIVYNITTPTAITDYNTFNLKDKYRLVSTEHTFDIDSINQGARFTQLVLKEVL